MSPRPKRPPRRTGRPDQHRGKPPTHRGPAPRKDESEDTEVEEARFLALDYLDTKQECRISCVLVQVGDDPVWRMIEGSPQRCHTPEEKIAYALHLQEFPQEEGMVMQMLSLPDHEKVGGDAEWYWRRSSPV